MVHCLMRCTFMTHLLAAAKLSNKRMILSYPGNNPDNCVLFHNYVLHRLSLTHLLQWCEFIWRIREPLIDISYCTSRSSTFKRYWQTPNNLLLAYRFTLTTENESLLSLVFRCWTTSEKHSFDGIRKSQSVFNVCIDPFFDVTLVKNFEI